jgi:hypothetical protein
MPAKLAVSSRHHLLSRKTIITAIGVGSEVAVTDPVVAGDLAVIEIAKVTATGFTTTTLGALARRSTFEGVGRGARPGIDTGPPPVGGK